LWWRYGLICRVVNGKNERQSGDVFAFFNGFGADFSFWDNVLPYFSDHKCVLLSENYFDEEKECDDKTLEKIFAGKRIVGVGHSLGYAKLCEMHRKYPFFKLKKIVALEGFSDFLGKSEPMRTVRKASLDYMKLCYTADAVSTLAVFQFMCGKPFPKIASKINRARLFSDLDMLEESTMPADVPHLILASLDDPVIPFFIVEDNFRNLPEAEIVYTCFASHLLGMRFPKYVQENILKFAG
jgi:pimeloyl-ACP methyl ester carboxylesterase